MQTIKATITGTNLLLMHNERLANPMDPMAKEIKAVTGKRKKSDEDLEEISYLKFKGGLYHDEDIGPYIPSTWIEGTIRDSAKMSKRGTDVKRGVIVIEDQIPLQYEGPRDIDEMWKAGFYDQRMVKIGQQKVLATRPRFPRGWKAEFTVSFDTGIFDAPAIKDILENAGRLIGVGDYRPRFGRFEVEVK